MTHKRDPITGPELEVRFRHARGFSAAGQPHFAFLDQRLRFAARLGQARAK